MEFQGPEHAYTSASVTTTETRMEPVIPRPFEKKKNMPRKRAPPRIRSSADPCAGITSGKLSQTTVRPCLRSMAVELLTSMELT
jgi:hypothetical protein